MSENEAIEVIRDKACNDRYKEIHCDDSCMYSKDKCAFCMAIKALEEIQQYRAIGTIEELQALKEKSVAKKPNEIDERAEENFYYLAFTCPTCGSGVIGQPYRPNNCKHCGQKLDWQ